MLEVNLKYLKAMPKGDFLTDGINFISRRKHQIFFFKLEDDRGVRNIPMNTNVVNITMTMSTQHVLILQDFSFSVLNLNSEQICLKGVSSVQFISTSSNSHVVSILDAQHTISLFTWTGNSITLVISHLSPIRSAQPNLVNLLAHRNPHPPPPLLILHQSLPVPQPDSSDSCNCWIQLCSFLPVVERSSNTCKKERAREEGN